jgi:hypothetical protein
VWAYFMHEFGHAVMHQKFNMLPDGEQLAVYNAWETWIEKVLELSPGMGRNLDKDRPFETAVLLGYNPRRPTFDDLSGQMLNITRARTLQGALDPSDDVDYWVSFGEWFAENVSRWATSGERPQTLVERTMASFARVLKNLLKQFHDTFGRPFEANGAIAAWLDSYVQDVPPWGQVEQAQRDFLTREMNQRAIEANGEGSRAEPAQAANATTKAMVEKAFKGVEMPKEVRAAAAHGDRMTKGHYYVANIYQVAANNPYLRPLQNYVQKAKLMVQEMNQMLSEGAETIKIWDALGAHEADKVTRFLDDYGKMAWLTQEERNRKEVRKPTQQEALDLFAKHKIDLRVDGSRKPTALDVIESLLGNEALFAQTGDPKYLGDFRRILDLQYKEVANMMRRRISDPATLARRLEALRVSYEDLQKKPFIPTLNFGQWSVEVKDGSGEITKFYTFKTKGEQKRAMKKIIAELDPFIGETEKTVTPGFVHNEAIQFLGMSRVFLEALEDTPQGLSDNQKEALEQMKKQNSLYSNLESSFFMRRGVEGYSTNFKRAYSHFMFHNATHLMRMKYRDDLVQHMKEIDLSTAGLQDKTKREQIHWMVEDHFDYIMRGDGEWAWLTGFTFVFHLGFNVASAMVNLTQVPGSAYPYMSSKFGFGPTEAALMRSAVDWKRYWTRGAIGKRTEPMYRAISEGIKRGIITEALGPEVAGAAADRNVMDRLGKNPASRGTKWALDKAGYLFGMSEQAGRRAVFSAVWELAQKNQEPKGWQEILAQHELLYEDLQAKGWAEKEARSFVFATDAVEKSFYIYNRTARPKFMRGLGRPTFAFGTYVQNELFMFFGHDKDIAWRKLAMYVGMFGLMAIPGMEDLEDLFKAGLWGGRKDVSLEKEIRDEITSLFDGRVDPDLVLHGISRHGWGIPHFMAMLGFEHFPEFDTSGQGGLGNISPIQLAPFMGANADPEKAQLRGYESALGASFGLAARVGKFLTAVSQSPGEAKTWESLMPKAMNNVSQAYRIWKDEGVRLHNGANVIPYDLDNVQHQTELIGRALGFQNLRTTATWDYKRDVKQIEVTAEMQRQNFLNQRWEAVRQKDKELVKQIDVEIKRWNNELPPMLKGKRITQETKTRSTGIRAKNMRLLEQGLDPEKSNRPINEELRRLHPNAEFLGSRTVK